MFQEVEHIFSYDEIEYYEKLGINYYEEGSFELIRWFSEICKKNQHSFVLMFT
ncbi:hypothetical protein K2F40_16295 [Clostridium sp. CM028]|uniref:hypothetical protein n=1 Tax=Clostridium sp. CM028 TaxID=2851575 RepID=UPI001C6DEC7F|nr:hypothetical protein [Clostridium sp. CM028]MBW9150505.1 hypothetical protein [Clostridium sp. CM028]WLC62813.1 hypothetical protein KTC94_06030 [Clostridium sp. CM028]